MKSMKTKFSPLIHTKRYGLCECICEFFDLCSHFIHALAWLYPLFRSIRRTLMLVSRCVCTEEFWRSVGVIAVITIRCMLYTVSNIRFLFVFLFEWIIIVREYKSFATSPSPLPFHWTDGNSNETAMRHPIKSYTWKVEAAFLIVKAYLVQCEWLLWTQMMKILCTLLYLFYFFPPYKNWREKKRTKSFQIDELHTFFYYMSLLLLTRTLGASVYSYREWEKARYPSSVITLE